ncbi:MAG: hypothetical protein IT440_15020 [Phycisphaeraceae bacterium]|nr:hypothetical protein [Phycisphaeraceae bacterium]
MTTLTAALTSRQRMTCMLERRDHDRIPRYDGYWPQTIARWQSEGLLGDARTVLDMLRSDVVGVCWIWPAPFPGRREILEENAETEVILDRMGNVSRVWKHKQGTPEHIRFDCDCAEKWFRQYKPALLKAGLSVNLDDVAQRAESNAAYPYFRTMSGVESFEAMRQLVGDEVLLAAMALEPEWVRDMSRTYTDLILRDFQAVLDRGLGADAVWVFGDLGYCRGPFFSPSMYRQLIWPDHVRMRKFAHERGLKFIYHTDGDVRTLLDLFVEAGFDCLQPMEAKAHMDVRELAPKYGQKLSFFGNIDMVVAGRGDRDEIEHEIRTKLAAGMSNRGYAYHSDHSVHPGVSWASYQWIIELIDRYGGY